MNKKITNVFLIIGGALLLIGLVIAGVGLARGGLKMVENKIEAYHDTHNGKNEPFVIDIDSSLQVGEKYTETIDAAEISIKVKAANISIVNDSETYVETANFRDGRISFAIDGDKVSVIDNDIYLDWSPFDSKVSVTGSVAEKIILHINAKEVKKVNIEVGAASIDLSGLNVTDELELTVGAGELNISEGSAEKLNLHVAAGEVVIENFAAKECKVELGAAAMIYDGTLGKKTEISVGTGTVELKLDGSVDNYYVEASVGLGGVSVAGRELGGLGQVKSGNSSAENRMKLECGLGSISVDFK